jgi:hypothetical protein
MLDLRNTADGGASAAYADKPSQRFLPARESVTQSRSAQLRLVAYRPRWVAEETDSRRGLVYGKVASSPAVGQVPVVVNVPVLCSDRTLPLARSCTSK